MTIIEYSYKTIEKCHCLLLVNCLKEDKMKTSSYISQNRNLNNTNPGLVQHAMIASAGLLLTSSHLILSDPASYWYFPVTGMLFFMFLLAGFKALKAWPAKISSQTDDLEDLDYISPLIITKFGKKNIANNKLFKTIT